MASSKKKSSKKPAAKAKKKKAAPVKASKKAPAKKVAPKKKAGKPAPKAAAKKTPKPAAKKAAPKAKAKAKAPTAGDAWDNASMAPKVAATTPATRMSEPSLSPPHALHDHAGGLVSPPDEQEELAERLHDGEEAVKDEDLDGDAGSPRLDDREDEDE